MDKTMKNTIRPGKVWLDTEGKRIQAHGGSMFYENDTFYWYGENKEKTVPGSGIWHWGVRCYSSKDLCNWNDEGLIIEPDLEHQDSPLHPSSYLDRPHILYNDKTKKYVCWIKFSGMDPANHYFTIFTSDHLLGKYELAVPELFPNGAVVGDFDIAKDENTGKAYLYAEADVTHINSYTLTEDYLGVEEKTCTHFEEAYREGPAHFSETDSITSLPAPEPVTSPIHQRRRLQMTGMARIPCKGIHMWTMSMRHPLTARSAVSLSILGKRISILPWQTDGFQDSR